MFDEKNMQNRDLGGMNSAIRRRRMKDMSPNTLEHPGGGHASALESCPEGLSSLASPGVQAVHPGVREQLNMDHHLTADQALEVCMARNVSCEVDEALHKVIGAFFENDTRVLVDIVGLFLARGRLREVRL